MLADFSTKLLQGSLCIYNFIMGDKYADGDQHTHRSVLDEDENNVDGEAEAMDDVHEPAGIQFHEQNSEPMGSENQEKHSTEKQVQFRDVEAKEMDNSTPALTTTIIKATSEKRMTGEVIKDKKTYREALLG